MQMIEVLHTFLNTCPQLVQNRIEIDYLPTQAGSYALEIQPSTPWVQRYVDGSGIRQVSFLLASREWLEESLQEQTAHLQFYERFADWLTEQTRLRQFPALEDGKKILSIQAVSSGYSFEQDKHTTRYQIQCKLLYFQPKEAV